MLLENLQKASTSEPDQMGIYLNSLDSEPKPECMRKTYVTSYLQIMRPLQLTLRRTFSGFLDRLVEAYRHFGLTISLTKTQVMRQDNKEIPLLFIHNYILEVVHEFVYLGSTITDNLSIDSELNKRIGKNANTLSRLTKHVWSINKLFDHTKVNVYGACVISTLLYGI